MLKKILVLNAALFLFCQCSVALAGDYEVGQLNKQFTVKQLTIKTGDSVRFTNQDPFYHNIFSLSEAKSFDLGSFKKGKYRSITFDKTGTIDVECAIHPNMKMTITVDNEI